MRVSKFTVRTVSWHCDELKWAGAGIFIRMAYLLGLQGEQKKDWTLIRNFPESHLNLFKGKTLFLYLHLCRNNCNIFGRSLHLLLATIALFSFSSLLSAAPVISTPAVSPREFLTGFMQTRCVCWALTLSVLSLATALLRYLENLSPDN